MHEFIIRIHANSIVGIGECHVAFSKFKFKISFKVNSFPRQRNWVDPQEQKVTEQPSSYNPHKDGIADP